MPRDFSPFESLSISAPLNVSATPSAADASISGTAAAFCPKSRTSLSPAPSERGVLPSQLLLTTTLPNASLETPTAPSYTYAPAGDMARSRRREIPGPSSGDTTPSNPVFTSHAAEPAQSAASDETRES